MAIVYSRTLGLQRHEGATFRLVGRRYTSRPAEYQVWKGRRIIVRHMNYLQAENAYRALVRPPAPHRCCHRCGKPLKLNPLEGGCHC